MRSTGKEPFDEGFQPQADAIVNVSRNRRDRARSK